MHHFFLPPECTVDRQLTFPEPVARQIVSVLRLKAGESVVVLDNRGNASLVELVELSSKRVIGQVIQAYDGLPLESGVKVTLYVSLTQREKFELILQKCTELGVSSFVPVIYSRSLVQSPIEADGKRERWEGILREAAEQCERLLIPTLHPAMRWSQAVKYAPKHHELNLVMWENEREVDIDSAFSTNPIAKKISLFIGPEGGITDEEIELIEGDNMVTVSLGTRILRMETAAISATAIVLYRYGCMLPDYPLSGEEIPF